MISRLSSLALSATILWQSAPYAPAQTVIMDMETVRHRPTEVTDKAKNKVPIGTLDLVPGKFGKAVQFNFIQPTAGFMATSVRATPEWNQAKGFSFYLKGDGSTNWGGLELIDSSNYGLRYAYCFPLDKTEWTKVVVPWEDLTPELSGPLVNAQTGYAPAGFGNLWFGKWFYWRDYPPHSFTIDQIVLEQEIPTPTAESSGTVVKRFLDKLKNKQPVTIVTMGDSLTDKRHWANRQTVWCEQLVQQITNKYGSPVKLINPAIGGTTLSQNLVLMPQWVRQAKKPDLVTICFGFNDWDSGVRSPRFKEYLAVAIDRIRRSTGGSADILLLTTSPAHSRWETMKEMEQAVKEVSSEKQTGLADISSEFRRAGTPDAALQQAYWAWDKTHLGAKGHQVVAECVLRAIETAE